MELTLIFSVVVLAYAISLVHLYLGHGKISPFVRPKIAPKTPFTLIVPFRNEQKKLPHLLRSFAKLEYPSDLIEIIFVDDDSHDESARRVLQWRIQHNDIDTTLLSNLRLTSSPKKDAIARALPVAKHSWILTTDADCIVPKKWLKTFDTFIQTHDVAMIAAPVIYTTKNNWFHQFQQLDLLSLQGTTMGSFGNGMPFMCNGANFAYKKSFFNDIGGFNDHSSFASGDDVFLLQKAVLQFPNQVAYLRHKDAIVATFPENDLYQFIMQRIRWAAKTSGYKSRYPQALALLVYATNLSLLVSGILTLFEQFSLPIFITLFVVKYLVDYLLLAKTNAFFHPKQLLLPLASSCIYPLYSVGIGTAAIFGGFVWKGRKFKR